MGVVISRWWLLAMAVGVLLACSDNDDENPPQPDAGVEAGVDAAPDAPCEPGELCVTVRAEETTGAELRLMLYEAEESEWPQAFRSLPTPSWVLTEYPPVPDRFPVRLRIPYADALFAISTSPLEGARVGLAVVTGVSSIMGRISASIWFSSIRIGQVVPVSSM